jgi:hypothetical protein
MADLASPRVREAILASRDQAAAVGMMLQANGMPDLSALLAHAQLVLDGRISPLLLWVKHPVAIGVAGVLALALLLLFKRLLFPARPKVVIRHAPGAPTGRGRGRG